LVAYVDSLDTLKNELHNLTSDLTCEKEEALGKGMREKKPKRDMDGSSSEQSDDEVTVHI